MTPGLATRTNCILHVPQGSTTDSDRDNVLTQGKIVLNEHDATAAGRSVDLLASRRDASRDSSSTKLAIFSREELLSGPGLVSWRLASAYWRTPE